MNILNIYVMYYLIWEKGVYCNILSDKIYTKYLG